MNKLKITLFMITLLITALVFAGCSADKNEITESNGSSISESEKATKDNTSENKADDNKEVESTGIIELTWNGQSYDESVIDDFSEFLNNAEKPIFIDFWAEWCPPCKQAAPFVESLSEKYSGKLHILKADVDQKYAQEISRSFNVQGIPAFFIIKNGEIVSQFVGYAPSVDSQIEAAIEEHIQD